MILITGANGFIGSALVSELNRAGRQDLILTDLISLEARPELLRGKIYQRFTTPQKALEELLAGQLRPEWVLHIGACSDTTESNWEYLLEVNVRYTQKLFEWCASNSIPLIYASSAAVYGDGSKSFKENAVGLEPLNLYGKSKYEVDQWIKEQTSTPPHWYGLRFFNVYGPNENFKGTMSSVVFKAYHQIRETGKLRLFKSQHPDYKDGEQKRDFIYVKDITRWILELMNKKPASEIYNNGSGQARTWLDLAAACFQSMGKPLQIEWIDIPEELREKYQYFTQADMTAWSDQYLSPPQYSLEEGVRDYIQNYLQRGNFL